jgi:hypothetical protein
MLTGQCYCGAIQYQVKCAPTHQALCHCTMCRGTSGAPCLAWFTVPRDAFHLLSGAPVQFRASDHATRSFCGACGTQLTFVDDLSPDELDVTTCSLHDPAPIAPAYQCYTDSALPWMPPDPQLPRYPQASSADARLARQRAAPDDPDTN